MSEYPVPGTPLPWRAGTADDHEMTTDNGGVGIGYIDELDDARYALAACNAFPQLVAALEELAGQMPSAEAPCHSGICPQSECGFCSRIARAHTALKLARGES